MLNSTIAHLIDNVIAAAADYSAAEDALSQAYNVSDNPLNWEREARLAKRRAAELAIAIDGLADRAKNDLGSPIATVRSAVGALCLWPGTTNLRTDCLERVRAVANAYKHQNLSDPSLPIASENDILVVGLGYGLEGHGVGKYSGVEVLVKDKSGIHWKFLGDAPVAIAAWFQFLANNGATLPVGPFQVCGIQAYP